MLIQVSNAAVNLDAMIPGNCKLLKKQICRACGIDPAIVSDIRISRRSVDARKKSDVHFVLTVLLDVNAKSWEDIGAKPKKGVSVVPYREKPPLDIPKVCPDDAPGSRPVVVGAGPAGLFCALYLARAGMRPILVERGEPVEEREKTVNRFFSEGVLNPDSNIQFGEGGAGTFSDGKLTTGTKSPFHPFILQEFVSAGAPEDILIDAKPHIGTDYLKVCIPNIRRSITDAGGEVLFNTLYCGLELDGDSVAGVSVKDLATGAARIIPSDTVVLATGHSARDVFCQLEGQNVAMERKPFACGVRIEHPQRVIDRAQYGKSTGHPALPPADYKLAVKTGDGRGVYTFCMCPGGQVVAAASEEGGVCVNGMSNHARNGENANSALLVEVRPDDLPGNDVLAGVEFQRRLEAAAYTAGGGQYAAPSQTVGSFMGSVEGNGEKAQGKGKHTVPTYPLGTVESDLRECLPPLVSDALEEAIPLLGKRLHGFDSPEAVMTAVEARSSSPVRILRDRDTLQSVCVKGLYPAGEGAGYAGGIMSAASDGLRVAAKITERATL